MALITRKAKPSLATMIPCPAHQVGSNLIAGEALAVGDACYIKAADGRVYRSIGTTLGNEASRTQGIMLAAPAVIGDAVTLLKDIDVEYAMTTPLVPGAPVFVGGTAGRLDTAATTGGVSPCGFAIDATRIRFTGSFYA